MTKKEYAKARNKALRQIESLNKAGMSAGLVKNYKGGKAFPAPENIKTSKQMAKAVHNVESFLNAKTSTLKGARDYQKRVKDTLKMAGMKKVSNKDVSAFGEFMKYARESDTNAQFDSQRAVDAFKTASNEGFDPKLIAQNFDAWQEMNLDDAIEEFGIEYSSDEIEFLLKQGTEIMKGRKTNGNQKRGNSNKGNVKGNGARYVNRSKSATSKKKSR